MYKSEKDEIKKRINEIDDLRKRKVLNSITRYDNWYQKISLDTFLSIMTDLGYSFEESLIIFKKFNCGGLSDE